MTIQFSTCVLFSILIVILLPNPATAEIITSGDISPPYPGGSPDPWILFEDLFIGDTADGSMEITDGSEVTNLSGFIGYDPTGSGIVTVTGQGSLWQNSGFLFVGGNIDGPGGTGLLDISNGGTVEAVAVVIWPAGTLSGDGLVSGAVGNAGTIKPGNSIGTLTIDGDLEIVPGGIYEVEVDNSGNSDLLSVTGYVDIDGGTVKAVSTETITGPKKYTIIEANNFSGTFDSLDTALLRTGLFPDTSLSYGTDSVMLQIEATRFDDPSVVHTDNQSSLGRALQQIAEEGGNSITTALQNLESAN